MTSIGTRSDSVPTRKFGCVLCIAGLYFILLDVRMCERLNLFICNCDRRLELSRKQTGAFELKYQRSL